jgi:hypothetical protein
MRHPHAAWGIVDCDVRQGGERRQAVASTTRSTHPAKADGAVPRPARLGQGTAGQRRGSFPGLQSIVPEFGMRKEAPTAPRDRGFSEGRGHVFKPWRNGHYPLEISDPIINTLNLYN